jgi:hypothetical protein
MGDREEINVAGVDVRSSKIGKRTTWRKRLPSQKVIHKQPKAAFIGGHNLSL